MPDATCCLRIRVPESLRPQAGLHPEGLFLCGGRSLVVPWGSVLLSLPWTTSPYEETDLFPVSTVRVEHLLGTLEKEGEGEDLSL